MVIAVLANETTKADILSRSSTPLTEWVWADSLRSLLVIDADAYFDLLGDTDPERVLQLKKLLPRPVFVDAREAIPMDATQSFVRISIPAAGVVGMSTSDDHLFREAAQVLDAIGWTYTKMSADQSASFSRPFIPSVILLSIDTALGKAGVCVTRDGEILSSRTNDTQHDHASWLHLAIKSMLEETGITMASLDAVAVAAGPGSYTGLRVGMAAAKGICFAIGIPLITVNSLYLVASGVKNNVKATHWICPMIDARRMEVFTAMYDELLQPIFPEAAMILDEHSFHQFLESREIIFAGDGSVKWQAKCNHPNALFSTENYSLADLSSSALRKYQQKEFADLAYSEPSYVKNFYTGIKDA